MILPLNEIGKLSLKQNLNLITGYVLLAKKITSDKDIFKNNNQSEFYFINLTEIYFYRLQAGSFVEPEKMC